MAEIPQNTKFWLFMLGPRKSAIESLIVCCTGIVTMILGVVSAATNNALGLGANNWFFLSIILFLWGIAKWFIAYFGAKEGYER